MQFYYLLSLGCAKNLVDSERYAAIMRSYELYPTEDLSYVSFVLVNSCAFLEDSLAELDDALSEIIALTNRKKVKIVVTGCVMNRALEEFKDLFPEVKGWIPLKDFEAFEQYLLDYILPKRTKKRQEPHDYKERCPIQEGQHVYLRIADGCENHCSYCLIPSIRGPLQSVPIEELVAEAKTLTHRGKELVLIAQDSCLYGMDIYKRQALPELIEALHAIKGFKWIRIMYMHPDHFLLEWTELWKKFPKLLPYFEIPIQHASDHILEAMNRKKKNIELRELFTHIRNEIPNAVFRTTVILGFPGETDNDVNILNGFILNMRILYTGCFAFSPEEGTPASSLPNQKEYSDTQVLLALMTNLQRNFKEEQMHEFIGTETQVLIEGYDKEMKIYYGRPWFMAPEIDGRILIHGVRPKKGSFVTAEIIHALDSEMIGVVYTKDEV